MITEWGKWIPASEMLPTDDSRVLAFAEYPQYGTERYLAKGIVTARYYDGKWKCDTFLGNRVIAWMPLPEFPREV